MTVRYWIITACASGALFLMAWAGFSRTLPERHRGHLPGTAGTPFLHLEPSDRGGPQGLDGALATAPRRQILIVHGLNSNKEFMQILALALTDGGFETWVIDLPGHGDSSTEFDSDSSVAAIGEALDTLPEDTIVLGHSMGAALLAEMSMARHFDTAILLSPPPIPLAPLDIDHLLVVSGRFDAPRINEAVPALIEMTGPDTEWWLLPWAGHSSSLFNPGQLDRMLRWLGSQATQTRTRERLFWLGMMLVSCLAVPGAAIGRYQARHPQDLPVAGLQPDVYAQIASYIGALGATLALMWLFNPLSWLRLFRTDYLVGLLLITGLLLWGGRRVAMSTRGAFIAVAAAVGLILALSVAGSQFMHLVPSGGQWLRLPILVLAVFPLALADERRIRPIRPKWRMWGVFILVRLLIWAAVLTGVLLLNPDSAFLVLVTHFFVVAWIPLWWVSGLVARAAREEDSAALFSSLIQGWVFAALFVTI